MMNVMLKKSKQTKKSIQSYSAPIVKLISSPMINVLWYHILVSNTTISRIDEKKRKEKTKQSELDQLEKNLP